jgi:hypothetical protein
MALINAIIPPQRFEIARDAIGLLLFLELQNQHTLDPTFIAPSKVDIEKTNSYDANTEYPAINVKVWRGDYDNAQQTQADGTYKFAIVGYTKSAAVNGGAGDKLAAVKLQKLLGKCRAILSNPVYNRLGLPELNVKNTKVGAIVLGVTDETQGAENSVVGYLEFYVKMPELVTLIDATPLLASYTTVKLYNTEEGYYWSYSELSPP